MSVETPVALDELIDRGLQQRFQQQFGSVLYLSNASDKKLAVEKLRKSSPAKYPYALASVTSWTVRRDSYKPKTLLRRGLTSQASSDNVQTFQLSLVPVQVAYELTYITADIVEFRKFARNWVLAGVGRWLNFNIVYGVANLSIPVILDDTLTFPQREADPTEIQEYVATASFTLDGYIAQDLMLRQAATDLEIDAYLKSQGLDADSYDPLREVRVFSTGSRWSDRFQQTDENGNNNA